LQLGKKYFFLNYGAQSISETPVREGEPNIPISGFFWFFLNTFLNIDFIPFADPRTTLAGSKKNSSLIMGRNMYCRNL